MKTLLRLSVWVCLAPLLSGCFLMPANKIDGSESFNEAHPEYNNPPEYMQPGDRHADGN